MTVDLCVTCGLEGVPLTDDRCTTCAHPADHRVHSTPGPAGAWRRTCVETGCDFAVTRYPAVRA